MICLSTDLQPYQCQQLQFIVDIKKFPAHYCWLQEEKRILNSGSVKYYIQGLVLCGWAWVHVLGCIYIYIYIYIYVCAYGCIHVYGCGLTMGVYISVRVCMYFNIGSKTYLDGNHWFFSARIKCRCQIKRDQWLKKFFIITPLRVSWNLVVNLCANLQCWVAKSPEVWVFTSGCMLREWVCY